MSHSPIKQLTLKPTKTFTSYISLAALLVLTSACSMSLSKLAGGNHGGGDGGGDGGGGSGPLAQPASLDLNVTDLSPNGCLDLQMVADRFHTFPQGSVIREYTQNFEMENQSVDSKQLPRLRNMTAETAFSNFAYEERGAELYVSDMSTFTQTGCTGLDVTNQLGSTQHFSIVSGDEPNALHIKSADGQTDISYILKSARSMDIITVAPRIDRCPDFLKAIATTTRTREWGSQAEIDNTVVKIKAELLRKISVAVREMPDALATLLSVSSGDTLQPETRDLRQLKNAALDPNIVRCPFDATPPSADEPPPPEETVPPAASPTPAPSPAANHF
jgi:hypothetical protein